MKGQVFILTLISIICLTNPYALAQISEGGTPISFSLDMRREKIPVLTMPAVNARALIEEDEKLRAEDVQRPFRFGYAIDVDIDIKKSGAKTELPNGDKLWLLKIHCPDAYSINLIYNYFKLGEGSKFFIYNEDRTMILGAFTPEVSNNPYNEFATDLVQGNTIILEYYEPKSSDDGVININKVIHGYVNTFFSNGLGTSANCNVDVMCCLFGNNWVNEERAVTLILVDNNTALCSGCLLNNTRRDFTPYILTARHCYFDNNGNTQSRNPTTSIFRFLYWRPNCAVGSINGTGTPTGWQSITGATMRANWATTDFALLQLNTRPPASWNLYYAGWDRTLNVPAQSATEIHHPRGDAMKISHEQHPVVARNQSGLSLWSVQHFENGTVQGGSSGSPLFNQNHRIVGQLSGRHPNPCASNDNTCDCNNPIGDYGRFDLSWTGGVTNATRLSNWLAPIGTIPQTLDGIFQSILSGQDALCSNTTYTYTITGIPSDLITNTVWTSSSDITLSSQALLSVSASPTNPIPAMIPGYPNLPVVSSGWLSATVTISSMSVPVTINQTITAGNPAGYIIGPMDFYGNSVYATQPGFYKFQVWGIPYSASVMWVIDQEATAPFFSLYSGEFITVYLNSGFNTICMQYTDACGNSVPAIEFITVSRGGSSSQDSTNNNGCLHHYIVYPNPASTELTIDKIEDTNSNCEYAKSKTTTTIKVLLYSHSTTKLVFTQDYPSSIQQIKIDTSKLPNGVYYLNIIENGEKIKEQTIIVNH